MLQHQKPTNLACLPNRSLTEQIGQKPEPFIGSISGLFLQINFKTKFRKLLSFEPAVVCLCNLSEIKFTILQIYAINAIKLVIL